MKHLGLFEGIGGFSLAARNVGWETVAWCEWNEFGQRVLKHHFPEAEGFGDITKTDFKKYANKIDIITGGFPCQPYSLAGKRKGKEDERHLWPEMLRAIREIQPRWVVGENVFGLINWSDGLVFHEVQADLEAEGYEVFPYVLPAAAVNAPHRRDRVWFIAYSNSARLQKARSEQQTTGIKQYRKLDLDTTNTEGLRINRTQKLENGERQSREWGGCNTNDISQIHGENRCSDASNPNSNGQQRSNCQHEVNASEGRINAQRYIEQMGKYATDTKIKSSSMELQQQSWEREFRRCNCENGYNRFENFPTQSPICGGDDGLPTRLDGITFSKWRAESIKAYGNAIVPQVAEQIFKTIIEYEKTL